jgi:hypothetical protein
MGENYYHTVAGEQRHRSAYARGVLNKENDYALGIISNKCKAGDNSHGI